MCRSRVADSTAASCFSFSSFTMAEEAIAALSTRAPCGMWSSLAPRKSGSPEMNRDEEEARGWRLDAGSVEEARDCREQELLLEAEIRRHGSL